MEYWMLNQREKELLHQLCGNILTHNVAVHYEQEITHNTNLLDTQITRKIQINIDNDN